MKNRILILCLTISLSLFISTMSVNALLLRNQSSDTTEKDYIPGYVIKVNDDETYVIDIGADDSVKLYDELIVYTEDEIIIHPLTGEEQMIRGKQVAKGLVKDVYADFSVITLNEIKNHIPINPAFFVKIIKNETKQSFFKRNRRSGFKFKRKPVTTLSTSFSSGMFGKTTLINEEILVGYRFPSSSIFCFELQLAQSLFVMDVWDFGIENDYLVYGFANAVFHIDFWKENGGLGIVMGAGFSRSGFSGNAGFIIGNMNSTGLHINFYGIWNRAIMTDMALSIYVNRYINFDAKIKYSYWFNTSGMSHGLLFDGGLSVKIQKSCYLKFFGGMTSTMDENFGGYAGTGIKFVL